MQIFALDDNPVVAAKLHCDKHIVRMPLETAQMLSTVWHILAPPVAANMDIYRKTHANHPCTVWVRSRSSNYYWCYQLGVALCEEYTRRYGKVHKSSYILNKLKTAPPNILAGPRTPFAQAMPEEYQDEDPIKAYRNYYIGDKKRFAKYKNTELPEFLK